MKMAVVPLVPLVVIVVVVVVVFALTAAGGDADQPLHDQCMSVADGMHVSDATSWEGTPQCGLLHDAEDRASAAHGCWRRYVVRFEKYATQEEHYRALDFALRVERRNEEMLAGQWHWVWRDNPAVNGHPTDFGVVELSPSAAASRALRFETALARSPTLRRHVKDVHVDASFQTSSATRSLLFTNESEDADGQRIVVEEEEEEEEEEDAARGSDGDAVLWASKPPGRRRTRTSFEVQEELILSQIVASDNDDDDDDDDDDDEESEEEITVGGGSDTNQRRRRRRRRMKRGLSGETTESIDERRRRRRRRKLKFFGNRGGVTGALSASKLWEQGLSGSGVKVGIFDTGVNNEHPSLNNVKERSNFTTEPTLSDSLGHGSFVAGVIGSTNRQCLGFAQDVEIHTFRVYTNQQISYTSWFMDAFNYAIISEMEIINVSIGGPDFLDLPFADKTLEVIANGIIVFAAQGNDGPSWGTANHPAEEPSVIAIGGIDYSDKIASFTSRGMTLREFPDGYGRPKPDLMAYGSNVLSIQPGSGCRTLSGTSVASPVATGAAVLIASAMPVEHRRRFMNPGSMKQIFVESATKLKQGSIYEQGMGKINLEKALSLYKSYKPHASLVPEELDLTKCPYMWPHCTQPLYAGAMATVFNSTIVNGMGLHGHLVGEPTFTEKSWVGKRLDVSFEYSESIFPYAGWLAVFIRVRNSSRSYTGTATGTISFTVESSGVGGGSGTARSVVHVPLKVNIIPTPPRSKRVLWDMFHNIPYPPMFIPRDNLRMPPDVLDHHGDHPHTNFNQLYNKLRSDGYFIETLGSPFTCFDARQYGHLMIVDPEEEFHPNEIQKLNKDVRELGLDVVIFSDWYNVKLMESMRFYDDNTVSWWVPPVGGANVPALNDLLRPFGAELGDYVFDGDVSTNLGQAAFMSAGNIIRWPVGGELFGLHRHKTVKSGTSMKDSVKSKDVFVAGAAKIGAGTLSVFGDSSCMDNSSNGRALWLAKAAFQYADEGKTFWPSSLRTVVTSVDQFQRGPPVERRHDAEFISMSKVVGRELKCGLASPCAFLGTEPLSRMLDPFAQRDTDRGVDEESQKDEFFIDVLVNANLTSAASASKFRGFSVSSSTCGADTVNASYELPLYDGVTAADGMGNTKASDDSSYLSFKTISSSSVYGHLSGTASSISILLSMTAVLVICVLFMILSGRRRAFFQQQQPRS